MNSLREWLEQSEEYCPDDVSELERIFECDHLTERVVEGVISIYVRQNEDIGKFAQANHLEMLSLSEIEALWIEYPEGEKAFFERLRIEHPDEWSLVAGHFNYVTFSLFQAVWVFHPTRRYLISLGHNCITPKREHFYPKGDSDPEEWVFMRLRERFKPLGEVA